MNKIDMSLGWFTLGSSGDVQITSLNVGKGVLYTERNSRRVGINVGDPPPSLLATLQIGNPIGVLPQDVLNEGAMSMLIVADKGYRPTSFNQVGGGTLGFSNTLDSTIWVNTNDVVPPGQGTGISFGGRTPHGHFPFARMTGFRADDVLDRGGFSLEVLDTLPIDPDQYGELSGKPVLFERMRITGDGKVGFGGVSDPEFGVEIREDLGCNGIFNGGYERYEPTSYNVSGSTITDLNAVNVYGNLSQQTDTWYYSFENKSQTPSRNTCVRFDDNANVYTAAVVDVGFSETDAGIFREGESLIIPNLNSDVSIIPYKASLLFKTNPQGDPLWTVRFISYTNTFGVNPGLETILTNRQVSISEISTSRNENSVPGAERYDVYVQGITTGNVLDIFTIEDGNWKFVTQIIFSDWGTNNTFVARFESVFTGTSETGVVIKEFLAVEGSTIFPIGLDTVVPQTFIRDSIRTGSRTAFAVTSFKPDPNITSGLLLYYDFENRVTDQSGNGLDATSWEIISFEPLQILPRPMVYEERKLGNYAVKLFNGTMFLIVPTIQGVHQSLSVSFWVYIEDGNPPIASIYSTTSFVAGSLHINVNSDRIEIATPTRNILSPVLDRKVWYHVVFVDDGGLRSYLYINNTVIEDLITTQQAAYSLGEATISSLGLSRFFIGSIDEFRIYSTALSPNQVDELYGEFRDVTLKYSKGPFTSNGTALTVDYRSINSFYTSVIPPSQYVVSVFRIGGTGGDYLINTNFSSFYMTSNQIDILHFGITNPRAPLSQEGVVRIGRDVSKYSVFLTVPVKAGSISYKSNGDSVRTLTTLAHDGSIIIKTSDNFNFNKIDYFTRLVQNPTANSVCITRSIDVDRGTDGNGENSCSYIAGSFQNNFDLTRFTVSGANVVNTGPTFTLETGGGLEERSAFLLKLTSTGNPSWVTVIDGDNMDEGISVAVQDDVFQDQSGEYNVYLSGTFKGDGDDLYTAEIYDSSNDPVNPLKIESFASVIISQSEIGGTGGHEESFVAKFNYDGKYIFNYKATGTGDVSIKYIDVGPDGNLAMCGLKKTPLMRLQEPDGSISRYVPREDFECGFLVKFRTAGMLILPTPSGDNIINTYKKTIINTTGYPLYVAVYKPNALAKSIPNVSVVPGRKSMDFVYDGDIWVPEASDKLTTDLLYLDRDNGRFGFGTTEPRATVDIRGDIEVSGIARVGRDTSVNGNLSVLGNVTCGDPSRSSFFNVLSNLSCPYQVNGHPILQPGMIIMWTGTTPPVGWGLCDGQNGRPDLRGRFVIGYSDTSEIVANGGPGIYNPGGQLYERKVFNIHEVSGESLHTLLLNEMPSHTHTVPFRNSPGANLTSNNNSGGSSFNRDFPTQGEIDSGVGDITSATGTGLPHNNMPPYYVLAFIIKE